MYDADLTPDVPPTLGMVLEADRGSLPYALIHGEPLVRCAVIGLEEAGIEPIDADTAWPGVLELLEEADVLLLHDALSPLAPPDFLARCATLAAATGSAVVGYRPVTDTIKQVEDGRVGATVDREQLRALASPVALPAPIVRALPGTPGHDLEALVARLTEGGTPIEWIEAPPAGRRVDSVDDLRVLEALTAQ